MKRFFILLLAVGLLVVALGAVQVNSQGSVACSPSPYNEHAEIRIPSQEASWDEWFGYYEAVLEGQWGDAETNLLVIADFCYFVKVGGFTVQQTQAIMWYTISIRHSCGTVLNTLGRNGAHDHRGKSSFTGGDHGHNVDCRKKW